MSRTPLYVTASAIVVAATIGILSAALAWAPRADRTLRAENGCPRDRDSVVARLLLVDFTDAPTAAHASQLERSFRELRRGVPRDGHAIVALLDPEQATAVTIALDICNPGTKSGDYTDRPTAAKPDQIWLHTFMRPLDAAFEMARRSPQSAASSPIFEAITYLTQSAAFDGRVADRKLTVVSDGLQLTPGIYSQFAKGDPAINYAKSGLAARVPADLNGVEVEFVYLSRPEFAHRQTPAHRAFLRSWFVERGARSFTLRGVGPVETK